MAEDKIIAFRKDPEFYLRLAKKCHGRGEFYAAMEHCQRALAEGYREDVLLELAEIYLDSNHYDNVLDAVNCVLARNRHCIEAFRLAFRFFVLLEDFFSLMAYIKQGLEWNPDSPEFFLAVQSVQQQVDLEGVLNAAEARNFHVVGDGRAAESWAEKDRKELLVAQECADRARDAMEAGDYEVAEQYAANAILHYGLNVDALIYGVTIANARKDYDTAAERLDRLVRMELTDVNEIYKVVLLLCDVETDERILAYIERVEELVTLDDRLLQMKAIALFNLSRWQESQELFLQLHAVDDTFHIYDCYLKIVDGVLADPRRFETLAYTDQVPEEEYAFRVRRIYLLLSRSDEDFCNGLKDPETANLFKWALTCNEDDLVEIVVKRLFFSPLEPFLREMLVYSDVSYMVKKEIITQRLLRGDKEIFYSISDLIQSKKTKYARCYKDLSPLFREVYCRTLGVLYFSEFDYQRKLGARVAEMYRRSRQEGYAALNDPHLLTATLLHMVERTQYPVLTLLHIFNIEDDQLMLYIAAFTK